MNSTKSPWAWIPTLYTAEGIPYVAVTVLSLTMFVSIGMSNEQSALYTSWFTLPWVIKPLWSPLVDAVGTKRMWILATQFVISTLLACIAFTIQTSFFIQASLALFWIIAFASASHDISADGLYIIALTKKEQSFFVGIRSTFYRIATILCQGGLVIFTGLMEQHLGDTRSAWSCTFVLMALIFGCLSLYHLIMLPRAEEGAPARLEIGSSIKHSFSTFFKKQGIGLALTFILVYRLGEAQLSKITTPFLLDTIENGGLGLTLTDIGLSYGTIGVIALTLGGIIGGVLVSRDGLKRWFLPMLLMMNVPNAVYVYMASAQPSNIIIIDSLIAVEQFGYGFGFIAFQLFLIQFSKGEYSTSHYAICTGFMALGMLLPGMTAGYIESYLGYYWFFVWTCICTAPAFIVSYFVEIDE